MQGLQVCLCVCVCVVHVSSWDHARHLDETLANYRVRASVNPILMPDKDTITKKTFYIYTSSYTYSYLKIYIYIVDYFTVKIY